MAPEQHAGEAGRSRAPISSASASRSTRRCTASARSAATAPSELADASGPGRVREPAARSDGSGLAAQAGAPWPRVGPRRALSVDGSAAGRAARRDRRSSRRRWAAAAATLAFVAFGAVVAANLGRNDEASRCHRAADRLAGVWDAPRRHAIKTAFVAVGAGGADAWPRVERALDRTAQRWTAMRTEVCEATHVRGEQSPAMLDLRMECLDARLAELRALTDLFRTADAETVEAAVSAAHGLPELASCADGAALRDGAPRLTDAAAPERHERLARVRVLALTDDNALALEQSRALAAAAAAAGDRYTEAQALLIVANTLADDGDLAAAEETYYDVVAAAERARAKDLAADGWLGLVSLLSQNGARFGEAHGMARVARGAIDSVGGDPRLEANLADELGTLYARQGKLAEARVHLEQAIALSERHWGPETEPVADSSAPPGQGCGRRG